MNKKKIAAGVVALGLVAAIGLGNSLAWFTDSQSITNTMTTNKVDIELTEPEFEEEVKENLVPGDTILKDPTITLTTGSSSAWVRIKEASVVVTKGDTTVSTDVLDDAGLAKYQMTLGTGWSIGADGNFYYANALTADLPAASPLFTSVTLPSTWGNAYADATVTIVITAEAIQADNNDNGFDGVEDTDIVSYVTNVAVVD